jgi:hypothetical protein
MVGPSPFPAAASPLDLPVTAPGVLRALVGAAVYLALLAVIGTGIGWMLRR